MLYFSGQFSVVAKNFDWGGPNFIVRTAKKTLQEIISHTIMPYAEADPEIFGGGDEILN